MSAAPSPALTPELAAHLQLWAECLGMVLGQMAGGEVSVESLGEAPDALRQPNEQDLTFAVTFTGPLRGELTLRLAPPAAAGLAASFTGEPAPGEAAIISDEQKEAVLELLRQVSGQVATRLPATQANSQVRIEPAPAPTAAPAVLRWLQVGLAPPVWVEMQCPASFLEALHLPAPDTSDSRPAASTSSAHQLDTLMDVELEVALRFGSRRMLLRDILELCAGAVVELDRQVQEPVELLLDGRVVARGDVVVVDGNYGLRVTQIIPAVTLS